MLAISCALKSPPRRSATIANTTSNGAFDCSAFAYAHAVLSSRDIDRARIVHWFPHRFPSSSGEPLRIVSFIGSSIGSPHHRGNLFASYRLLVPPSVPLIIGGTSSHRIVYWLLHRFRDGGTKRPIRMLCGCPFMPDLQYNFHLEGIFSYKKIYI